MERFIVDAYNLLYADQELAELAGTNLEAARNKLLRQVALYASRKAIKITMVFDGRAEIGPSQAGGSAAVKILYSARPQSADDLIIRIVEKDPEARGITVVSSDNQVAGRARLAGASVLSSAEFISRLRKVKGTRESKEEKPDRLSEEEVKDWLATFGRGKDERQT